MPAPSSRLAGIHFKGPLYGDRFAVGGLLKDAPIELAGRRQWAVWFNDFINGNDYARFQATAATPTAAASDWVEQSINTPTTASIALFNDSLNGYLTVTAGTKDASGIGTQFDGSALGAGGFTQLTANKTLIFEARLVVTSPTNGFVAVGLANPDTSIMSSAGAITITDGICMVIPDSATPNLVTTANTTNTTTACTGATVSALTNVQLGFRCTATASGVGVTEGYVDGVKYATSAVTARTGQAMAPFVIAVNDTGNDQGVLLDYMFVAQER